jgi:thiol:disulfide interchange protein DsbD
LKQLVENPAKTEVTVAEGSKLDPKQLKIETWTSKTINRLWNRFYKGRENYWTYFS